MIIVDDVLQAAGDFGLAQWLMLALFSMVNVLSAFHYFAQTFITLNPDESCNRNSSDFENVSLPSFQYYSFKNINDELGWNCDKKWMGTAIQSMFFIGSVIGTFTLGVIADRLGRRPALILANLLGVTGNLLTAFLIPNIFTLGVARLIAGFAVDSNFFMMYILVMEYIRPQMRTVGLNLTMAVWYCVGCMAVPWVMFLCQDWRFFLTIITLPALCVPICAWLIPESAQWFISRGREQEALECFRKLATINGKEIPQEFFKRLETIPEESSRRKDKGGSIKGLFKTPNLRKKTCILIFKTMVLTLCYDAISRNIEGLGYDPLIMFTVSSATLLPSGVVLLLLQDRVGRKALAVFSLFITGILNLIQGGILAADKENNVLAAVVLCICGRFAVNIAYNSGTQYAAELIPTQVRAQGLSTMHVIGYVATFFSPQVLYMSTTWVGTPPVILGLLAVTGAILCMFLPETLGRTLPVSLEDGEAFGEDEKFWQFKVPIKKVESISSKL